MRQQKEHEWKESLGEMEDILKENGFGIIGVVDGETCYAVPLNYSYHDGGRIVIHCALEGKKLDLIRQNPKVCFTVARQLAPVMRHEKGNPCHLDSDSVICRGTARIVENAEERLAKLNEFNHFFRPAGPDLTMGRVENCAVVEITVKEMTGRQERKSKRTLWRWQF